MRSVSASLCVAVVDDDTSLLGILAAALRHHGFTVTTYDDGRWLFDAVSSRCDTPDVIVMDVMMPEVDGIAICVQLRAAGVHTPVLFLSALGAPADRVRGLTTGGDDYLTKPFDLDELVARVNILARRAGTGRESATQIVRYADLEVDDDAHRVSRHGLAIELTSTEYRLLHYLVTNADCVVSKMQILNAVWEYDFNGDASVVETYVYYLRRKVDTVEPKLIHTIRGAGYSLRLPQP
jgi:two-component system, OmpR family, response regulator